jgi:hypothetical protein
MPYFADLYRVPGDPDLHRWADWAELLCFTSASGRLSLEELAEVIQARRNYMGSESKDDTDPTTRRDEDPLLAVSPESADIADFNDATMTRALGVLYILEARADAYGDAYPFDIEKSDTLVCVETRSMARDLYLFLLACSTFRYVESKAAQTGLASAFEKLSLVVMRALHAPGAEVHLFGTSAANSGKFSGLLVDRIRLLASELGESTMPRFKAENFQANDRGDNGLDIVAWSPWSDRTPGLPISFGQCACTPRWVSKQHSSSHNQWSSAITFAAPAHNFCFIPFDFRGESSEWYADHDIHSTILVDRRRFFQRLGFLEGQTPSTEISEAFLDSLGVIDVVGAKNQELAEI